jgi:ferrochelatase
VNGALLLNLGSPDAPTPAAVRRYLREFLMDPRVLDLPWPLRWGLVHGVILPRRARASARAYRSIWTPEGPPLVVLSRRLQAALQARFPEPVELAMRYGRPSVAGALRRLGGRGVTRLHVIPLFPHYAMSSYETAVAHVHRAVRQLDRPPQLSVQPPFFAHPGYLAALTARARGFLEDEESHLLFSFHGVPERHLRKSDLTGGHCLSRPDCCEGEHPAHLTCYRHQCLQTARRFREQTGRPAARCSVAFQSRLGRDRWLRPYTDAELVRLARSGVRRLVVVCPSFVTDCLETLEEIGMRGRETFLAAGGEKFDLIPALNDDPRWLDALGGMIREAFAAAASLPPDENRR